MTNENCLPLERGAGSLRNQRKKRDERMFYDCGSPWRIVCYFIGHDLSDRIIGVMQNTIKSPFSYYIEFVGCYRCGATIKSTFLKGGYLLEHRRWKEAKS